MSPLLLTLITAPARGPGEVFYSNRWCSWQASSACPSPSRVLARRSRRRRSWRGRHTPRPTAPSGRRTACAIGRAVVRRCGESLMVASRWCESGAAHQHPPHSFPNSLSASPLCLLLSSVCLPLSSLPCPPLLSSSPSCSPLRPPSLLLPLSSSRLFCLPASFEGFAHCAHQHPPHPV